MMQANESVVVVLYATAILAALMWFCGTVATYVRGKVMESPNCEDGPVMNFFNKVFFVPTQELAVLPGNDENDALVNRWLRIGDNNTANIPVSLLVFFFAAQFDTLQSAVLVPLVWTFVAARFAHTFFYARSIQPLRTMSYSVGATCMIIAAVSLLVGG
jgi:uncharacterized membrane protein YecN with MAPEG domain